MITSNVIAATAAAAAAAGVVVVVVVVVIVDGCVDGSYDALRTMGRPKKEIAEIMKLVSKVMAITT